MIRVGRFSKTYGDKLAVSDLSFDVAPGDLLGLIGPNGAGKTTTLRALGGIVPPTSGSLSIAGYDIVTNAIEAKRRLALIPDIPNLFDSLTVWEHLEFTAQVYDVKAWQERADMLLHRLELAGQRTALADELSHGMRQKVVISCAMLRDPAALILDEPLTGLDPRGIRTLYTMLRERAAAGAAIVVSSHLLGQLESLCTRFLILHRGRRLLLGSIAEIRAQAAALGADASLEEIFFRATEGDAIVGES